MCFNIFFKNKRMKHSFVNQPSENQKIYCNICKIKKNLVKMKCSHTLCIKCISKTNYYDNDKCILCIE